jgi:hypothetical protein
LFSHHAIFARPGTCGRLLPFFCGFIQIKHGAFVRASSLDAQVGVVHRYRRERIRGQVEHGGQQGTQDAGVSFGAEDLLEDTVVSSGGPHA